MNMTLQMFYAFKTAAETGNFTHAAEKCYMTQPAFSRMIASMEKEMGVRLFERTTRHVALTEEGEICLRRVNQMLDAFDLLKMEMEQAKHSRSGNLRVGYNPVSGPPQFMLRALRRLSEEYPNMHVSLVRAYSRELVQLLEEGKLDCALVSNSYFQDTVRFELRPLQPIHLYALVGKENPLARIEPFTVRALMGVPMVFMANTAPRTRNSVLDEFMQQGIPPTEDVPVVDLEDMVMRVRIDDVAGITSFCDPNGQYPDVTAKRILEFSKTDASISRVLAWKNGTDNPGIQALNEILDKEAETKSENGVFPFD